VDTNPLQPIDRLLRVMRVWNWLPAFRAVAEVEHLRQAAEQLHITPSALSRTISQLEEQLGTSLFVRVGRNIQLTPAGQQLLRHVRTATRSIDDGIDEIHDRRFAGPLRWSALWALAPVVLRGFQSFLGRHPDVVPASRALRPETLVPRLLRGELDVAFVHRQLSHEDLVSVPLGELPHAIYCGPQHPLYGRKGSITLEKAAKFPFVTPPPDSQGQIQDGWPAEIPRTVLMHFEQMALGIQAVADFQVLAVLPETAVSMVAVTLRRLKTPALASRPVYAVCRRGFDSGPVEELIADTTAVLQAGPLSPAGA
jgi:DNA-binding transcriptional LysR family regulator